MRVFRLKSQDGKPIPKSNLSVQLTREDPRNRRIAKLIVINPDLFTLKKGRDY